MVRIFHELVGYIFWTRSAAAVSQHNSTNSTQLDLSTLGEYLRLNFPGTELAIFAFAQLMAEFLLIIIILSFI